MSFQSIPKMFDNIYVSTICITLLVLYISFLGPTLPPFIKTLFENTIFKIFVLFFNAQGTIIDKIKLTNAAIIAIKI